MRKTLKKRVIMSVAVWGKLYINEFLNYNLASMLSENNLPKSSTIADITFKLITTKEGKKSLLKRKLFKSLKDICDIEYFIIDDLLKSNFNKLDKYFFLNSLQTISLKSALNFDYLIFNYADFVWSDGGIYNIIKKINKNIDAIFGYCPIVQYEKGIHRLEKFRTKEKIIKISPREAVSWFIKNMHREEKRRFWDDKYFTVTPTTISWKVNNEGILITPFHKTILIFKVNPENILYYNGIVTTSLDGYFSGVISKNMNVKHINNSDEFFAVSLDHENTRDSRIGGPSRSNWLNYTRETSIKELLNSKVSEEQRNFSLFHYELILKKTNEKLWEYVKKSSENILKYYFEIFKFDPDAYSDHYSTRGFHELPKIDLSYFKDDLDNINKLNIISKILKLTVVALNFILRGTDFNFNGKFNRWRNNKILFINNAWTKLPAKYWLGHFDFKSKREKGKVCKSLIVPNSSLKNSLSIYGTDTKNIFRLTQKIPGFALLRAFSAGFIRSRFYVFTNTPNIDVSISVFSRINLNNNFEDSGPIFINLKDNEKIIRLEPGRWQLIEFELKDFSILKNKSLFVINLDGFENSRDNVLITDVTYHSKLDFERLRSDTNFIREYLSYVIYILLYYIGNNLKIFTASYVKSLKNITKSEIIHFFYKKKIFAILKLFMPKNYYTLSIKNKKKVLVKNIIDLLLKINDKIYDIHPLIYRKKVLNSAFKLTQFGLRLNENSFVLNYESFNLLFYQAKIIKSQKNLSVFLKKFYENRSNTNKPILIYINKNQININWISFLFSIIKYKTINNDNRRYNLIIENLNTLDQTVLNIFDNHFKFSSKLQFDDQYIEKFNCYFFPFYQFLNHKNKNLYQFCNLIEDKWEKFGGNFFDLSVNIDSKIFKSHNNLRDNDWYVFFDLTLKNISRSEGNRATDFNNQSIQDYSLCFNYIKSIGGRVIVLDRNEININLYKNLDSFKNIKFLNPKTPLVNILTLIKNCRLFVSSAYGLHPFANLLCEKICIVNFPFMKDFFTNKNTLIMPKLFYSIHHQKILSLREILKDEVLDLYDDKVLAMKGISLLYNTPEEIMVSIREALFSKKSNEINDKNIVKFKSNLKKFNKENNTQIDQNFSRIFMRKYIDILFK